MVKQSWKYGEQFSAPFIITIREKYCHNDVPERCPCTVEVTPVCDSNYENNVLLKVRINLYMEFIKEGVGWLERFTIVKILRGSITLSPLIVIPISEINLDSDIHIMCDHPKNEINTRLNEEEPISFIQNYSVTATLNNTRKHGIRDIQVGNDKMLNYLEKKFGIRVKQHKYYREEKYVLNADRTYKYNILPLDCLTIPTVPVHSRSGFENSTPSKNRTVLLRNNKMH